MEILNTRMLQYKGNIVSGLAKYMDIIILNKKCIIYNKPLNDVKTIFINTSLRNILINMFIDIILPYLTTPITLIISGGDYTFPNNNDKRMRIRNNRLNTYINLGNHRMIRKMFVENLKHIINEL